MTTQFAFPADLSNFGFPAAAMPTVTIDQQNAHLLSASALAEGYLRAEYSLPIVSWGSDLTQAVCSIAAWNILTAIRGYKPDGPDQIVRVRYEDAMAWLKGVANGTIVPGGLVDSSAQVFEGAPMIISGQAGNATMTSGNAGYVDPRGLRPPSCSPIVGYNYGNKRGW